MNSFNRDDLSKFHLFFQSLSPVSIYTHVHMAAIQPVTPPFFLFLLRILWKLLERAAVEN